MTTYTIEVRGAPAPQGSKKVVRAGGKATGRPIIVEDSKTVAPWREAVRSETQRAIMTPLAGPVFISLAFRLARPKTLRKGVKYPATRPDLDKLVRAVLDGLTMGGAWADDGQVVTLVSSKTYGEIPGCTIRVGDSTARPAIRRPE